ncbi:nitrogenase component 1 [Lacrimispora sp.]|uniref:nitrogenase component 1 n=1 Tax=Lacrimispora sp. TaxID=2719234 RepID=UPI00289FC9D8|nr:nitrogenase component 1 [Lacrimispora sp.]
MKTDCSTLHYTSPAHGGWGVVRLAMLVPESYQLFVCPFACGRHGALGAIGHGLKDRLSYLYIDESDIVSGGYEDLIPEAVAELLEALEKRPKVLMIFVSCLDDLLGTDHESILAVLQEQHEDVRFTFCHMNPITLDTDNPPPVNIRRKMYGLLEPSEGKMRQVNLIGNPVQIRPESELFAFLQALGIQQVNHIAQFETFEAYQQMAAAQWNLVIAPPAVKPAIDMKDRLNIDFELAYTNYREEDILNTYERLMKKLADKEEVRFNLEPYQRKARQAVREAREAVRDKPVFIDYTAVVFPFAAARALCEAGFHVAGIFARTVGEAEKEHADWIYEHMPEIQILNPIAYDIPTTIGAFPEDSIAIGFEAAYVTRARHVYGLVNNEGNYGFDGLVRLMQGIVHAVQVEEDLETLIKKYGLVI